MVFAQLMEEDLEEGAIVPMPLDGVKWEDGQWDAIILDVLPSRNTIGVLE